MKNDKGFILIEALAAIAIVSVSLTLITQSLLTNFRTGLRFQEGVRSLIVMENRLSLLYATNGSADQFLSAPIALEKPYERFRVQSQVRKLNDRLKQVQLTLSWPAARGERRLDATTIIYSSDDIKTRTYML